MNLIYEAQFAVKPFSDAMYEPVAIIGRAVGVETEAMMALATFTM